MTKVPVPDGFVTAIDAQKHLGRALYGTRWAEIEKASDDQRNRARAAMSAIRDDADKETIRSLGAGLCEASRRSWKYRTRVIIELLDALQAGTLRGYLCAAGGMPEQQPSDAWQDQALVDALSSGHVTRGGAGRRQPVDVLSIGRIKRVDAGQRQVAYVIVREDDLQALIAVIQTPEPGRAKLTPKAQSEKAKLRRKLRPWLEKETRVKAQRRNKKADFLARAQKEVDPNITQSFFNEVWRSADIPPEFSKRGRRPSD